MFGGFSMPLVLFVGFAGVVEGAGAGELEQPEPYLRGVRSWNTDCWRLVSHYFRKSL